MKSSRVASVVLTVALTTVVGGGAAYADGPGQGSHRVYLGPGGGPFTFTDVCAFPVDLTAVANEYIVKTTDNPDGSVSTRATGSLFVTLTNDNTGMTLHLNSSGPGTFTIYPDNSAVSDAQGPGVATFSAQSQANLGLQDGLLLLSGHTIIHYGTDEVPDSLSTTGKTVDLCTKLSG